MAGQAGINRRELLAAGVASGATLLMPGWARALAAQPCVVSGFRQSLTVMSPFTPEVLAATALTDGVTTAKTQRDVQRMYIRHGATEMYARINTRKPVDGLARARMAKSFGLPFNPELGLFGSYGDGATYQEAPDFRDYPEIRLPAPWNTLTIEQMLPPMRQYGALVAEQILGTGVTVDYWDLGNEVENGIAGVAVYPLFPTSDYQAPDAVDPQIGLMSVPELIAMPEQERIAWCTAHLWPYVAKLLAAAADGIRSAASGARFSTHISDFGQRSPNVQIAFWDVMKANGYEPDLLGTSYYPTDGRTALGPADKFGWLKDTAKALHAKHGRQIFIAEYAYPTALMPPPYPFNDPVDGYPQTPVGQHDFGRDLTAWGLSSGLLAGIRPWAPDYCTNSGWQPMSFFQAPSNGLARAQPGLGAIGEALAAHGCDAVPEAVVARFYGRRHAAHGVVVRLSTAGAPRSHVLVELLRAGSVVARSHVAVVDGRESPVVLRPARGRLADGRYTLRVRAGGRTLVDRRVRLG